MINMSFEIHYQIINVVDIEINNIRRYTVEYYLKVSRTKLDTAYIEMPLDKMLKIDPDKKGSCPSFALAAEGKFLKMYQSLTKRCSLT